MKAFSNLTREENINKMTSGEVFDIAIVGGGITGAGVARDAASRGMRVALVEARDFAVGTSSRSSKLIHGGIRYLENLEFGLVFEALSERRRLYDLAPHLVHPLRFLIPMYKEGRVGMFTMGMGMWFYDALAQFEAEMHEHLSPEETVAHAPQLKTPGLMGSYIYSDAYMDDDRLVLETLRAANELGAVAANYVSAQTPNYTGKKILSLTCKDALTGKTFELKAKHFVSSVGPWTDVFGKGLFSDWHRLLRPTKGIHLTLDRDRLPLKEAVVLATDADKRIVFMIPRHEMIIVGTTDTNFEGDPASVKATQEDVTYLLNIVKHYFPGANLRTEDLIASYAGVRPLVDDQSETESKTSREHKIFTDPRGITFVAGGKYTTYRHMSEQIVEEVLEHASLEERITFGKNNTLAPLNPKATTDTLDHAREMVSRWSHESRLDRGAIEFLVERHGTETADLLHLGERLAVNNQWSIEALHAIENTMCFDLEDFWFRRIRLFLAAKGHGREWIEPVSHVFAHRLGWSEAQRQQQIEKLNLAMATELGWKQNYSYKW